MLLLTSVFAVAAGLDVVQFTPDDFNLYSTVQNWEEARMITLNVSKGSTVYITNYVSDVKLNDWNPNPIPNLGDLTYKEGYNMSNDKFGYMIAERDANGKVTTDGEIHWGTKETAPITYLDLNAHNLYTQEQIDEKGWGTQTTTGYNLSTFDKYT